MRQKEEENEGGESPVRALCMALAGTLGVGNISGIALAISYGGAGSIFWMWVSAFSAMIIRYAEIVLALDEKGVGESGKTGNAMSYIKKAFFSRLGIILSTVFALLCILCSLFLGGVIQANVISEAFTDFMGYPRAFVGVLLSLLTALVIFGGRKKIASLTAKIVPLMTLLYIILSLFVIISRAHLIPSALSRIFFDAFKAKSAYGALIGIITSKALRIGVSRGLISNEAGCGTAPMAHATTNAKSPAKQGLFGIFEVFVDTILLCTLTAFVILVSFEEIPSIDGGGIMLVIAAFSRTFGKYAGLLISVSIFFFAFATIICWAFYGESCVRYFTDDKRKSKLFLAFFSLLMLYGAFAAPKVIWSFTDVIISLMTLINVFALIKMADRVVTLSADYGLLNLSSRGYARRGERPTNKDERPYRSSHSR
jgi:AGCS family alanine or glycine:cation symporter